MVAAAAGVRRPCDHWIRRRADSLCLVDVADIKYRRLLTFISNVRETIPSEPLRLDVVFRCH